MLLLVFLFFYFILMHVCYLLTLDMDVHQSSANMLLCDWTVCLTYCVPKEIQSGDCVCGFVYALAAWQEVAQHMVEGDPHMEGDSQGPVQYTETTPNPAMKSERPLLLFTLIHSLCSSSLPFITVFLVTKPFPLSRTHPWNFNYCSPSSFSPLSYS